MSFLIQGLNTLLPIVQCYC